MRWPWRRPSIDAAGLARAKRELAKARADELRVARIVEAHRDQQARNHFGERFHLALKGD